ncbi:MAG: hypothetical protein ACK504_12945 [Bacteroidota bacterium]
MKKIILSIALVAGLTTLSNAQDATITKSQKQQQKKDQTPEERAKRRANWAEKTLGLNATQKADWEVAALKRIIANQLLRDKLKGSTTPEERKGLHEQVKANNDAFDGTVGGFLTPEQKTKFETIKKNKHDTHKAKVKAGKAKADSVEDDIEG